MTPDEKPPPATMVNGDRTSRHEDLRRDSAAGDVARPDRRRVRFDSAVEKLAMRWPERSAPDHPEYGARALVTPSAGRVEMIVWTGRACSVDGIDATGWTPGCGTFTSLEKLASALERLDV